MRAGGRSGLDTIKDFLWRTFAGYFLRGLAHKNNITKYKSYRSLRKQPPHPPSAETVSLSELRICHRSPSVFWRKISNCEPRRYDFSRPNEWITRRTYVSVFFARCMTLPSPSSLAPVNPTKVSFEFGGWAAFARLRAGGGNTDCSLSNWRF